MREALRAHVNAARNVRGVRFIGGMSEKIPFQDPRFRECVKLAVEHGLSLDFNGPEAFPLDWEGVLKNIADLAAAFPQATIVLDHCGGVVGPKAFGGENGMTLFGKWKELITELAKQPNINVKLG
eukprot:6210370-Amphidinium_carterae.1